MAEARATLAAASFDLALLDLVMPGEGGLDLHRELAASGSALARRTIFMTGDLAQTGDRTDAPPLSVPILEKPFRLDSLALALTEIGA